MKRIRIYVFAVLAFAVLSAFWSLFYFIIGAISGAYGMQINPLLHHIISSILGIVVFGMLGNLYGHLHRSKGMSYFQTIIQAMRQMAKGNFEIKLDLPDFAPGPNVKNNPFVQLVDSMQYMAKELGQLERVRQEFISNVSHEIQSPLTSIKGFAKALENEHLSEEKKKHYLNIIQTETDRLSKLSDNLLKLTALEREDHPFSVTFYRLDRQIRQTLLSFEPRWSEKRINMEIDLEPVTIFADSELMSQVWANLIQNSIKFTPDKGKVSLSLKQIKNEAVFRISDTGIGIKPEDRIHLFERFYKADRSRNRAIDGNGLGLSIVKKIIDVHHGRIHVESQFGRGTTITVSLNNQSTSRPPKKDASYSQDQPHPDELSNMPHSAC